MTIPRKVLMLHGLAQNANIFSKRMAAIRKLCGKDIELVFIDAPNILQPADLTWVNSFQLGASEALDEDPALAPRGWWKMLKDTDVPRVVGLDETVALLKDILKTDRYEGVFGFSQGACLAALLAASLEKPHLHPSLLIDGQSPHPPFKFCVCVSGFKHQLIEAPFMEPSYATPTLHVIGKNDVIVTEERSRKLVEVSANKRVELHDGGALIVSSLGPVIVDLLSSRSLRALESKLAVLFPRLSP